MAGDPLRSYREAARPVVREECFSFPIDGLDRLGVPVFSVALWAARDGAFCNGIGYGATERAAQLSAWGEAAESLFGHLALAGRRLRRASYAALRAELGGDGVLDPRLASLPAGSPWRAETPLEWVPAQRRRDGATVLVPAELAATRHADLAAGPQLFTPVTNGLGAGPTLEHALAHAVLELVQRDGNAVSYRAMDRGIAISLETAGDPELRRLAAGYAGAGVDVIAKLADSELGIANVYVTGADRDPAAAPHPLSVTAIGEAAHPDGERALRKALLEFAASRARKPFNHASLDWLAPILPAGYAERFRAEPLGSEEDRSLEATLAWLELDAAKLRDLIADPVLAVRETVPVSALPAAPGLRDAGPEALLPAVEDRLARAGLDVLVVDLSPPGGAVRVVKAIVPTLEVEVMSYGRIGERGLRRLLARESPLVGHGPPPPGAAPIRLTPAAEAELGPAWLDLAAVERTVGPLYPLYREPGRHVAALAAEARAAG